VIRAVWCPAPAGATSRLKGVRAVGRTRSSRWLAVVGAATMLTAVSGGAWASGVLPTLREVQERLDSLEVAYGQLREQEAGLVEQLLSAEQALAACRTQLDVLQQLRAVEEEEVQSVADSLVRLEVETTMRRGELGRAFREAYVARAIPPVGVLLSAGTFGEAARRWHYLGLVAARQQDRLEAAIGLVRQLVAVREEAEGRLQHLGRLQEEEELRLTQLAGYRSERERLLLAVRDETQQHALLIDELQRRRDELELILEAAAPSTVTAGLGELRGRLAWPVEGRVVAGYGIHRDRQYWTKTFNPGVDIEAGEGNAVGVVAPGTVVYSGWHNGLGNLVVVDHGEGYYSLYGHLLRPRVAVGQLVVAGQQIGDVGDTLSLRGPCLHFQIRHRRQSLDPMEWLVALDG
jgi:septal ring factor EnvC (AmiA/AmiB activator)